MADVVHSVNLEQRLDISHDQFFPHNTPATIATTTPIQPLSASFGGFDLTGEQANLFDISNWSFIAMTLQQFQQFQLDDSQSNASSPQHPPSQQSSQQNSRHYEMTDATAFPNQQQYSHDTSVQQASIMQPSLDTPPFVEPSGNYIAISTTQSLPYAYPPPSTLPNTQSITLTNNAYIGNSTQHQQPSQQHQHQHQQHHHNTSNRVMTNHLIPDYNFNPNHCLQQREIYQNAVPSSIGNDTCQQQQHHHHHHGNYQKSIPSTINSIPSNFSRQDTAVSLPISIAPAFIPQFNNQTNNVLVPLYDHTPTIFNKPATISISQNPSVSTPDSTTTTTTTTKQHTYSGPPKSYYSRLPLYDRPFKCDQCPQSFNRNHDLKRHKRIHLAVKPYPCQYCEKQFSRKDALKRHILVKGCNNNNNNNASNKRSPNFNNKKIGETSTKSSISTLESYVDNGNSIKTEPASDNGFGMSI